MPKVAQETLDAFGKAVKRERSLRGWSLDELSAEMGGTSSRSFLSNVEGGKRQISPPTVGKLIKALDLDQGWIDRFLEDDTAPESEETPVDRETDRLLRLKAKDDKTPDAPEDLLIQLANTHAQGQYTDTLTAYSALKAALQAAERLRLSGEMPSNTGGQLQAVMAEVAKLNAQGRMDEADDLLEAEEKRMRAAHRAEKERQDAQAKALLDKRLDQDRLRNDPVSAAKRLIRDLHRQAPAGGVVRSTRDLLTRWREDGESAGDTFALRVALALAKANFEKAKAPMKGATLSDLGNCHLAIGERASENRHHYAAEKAYRAALKLHSKRTDAVNWAIDQNNLDNVLSTLGDRTQDLALLQEAVTTHKAALTLRTPTEMPTQWAISQDNLGIALQNLGQLNEDDALLYAAVEAHEAALTIRTQRAQPKLWARTKHNVAICLRSLARLTSDTKFFDRAEAAYVDALQVHTPENAPYYWADTIGGLGELELDRFEMDGDPCHLDAAEQHISAAQAAMNTASEYRAERCDDLLHKISAARATLP